MVMFYLAIAIICLVIYYYVKSNTSKDSLEKSMSNSIDNVIQNTVKVQSAIWKRYESAEGEISDEQKTMLLNFALEAKRSFEETIEILKIGYMKIEDYQEKAIQEVNKNFTIIINALK